MGSIAMATMDWVAEGIAPPSDLVKVADFYKDFNAIKVTLLRQADRRWPFSRSSSSTSPCRLPDFRVGETAAVRNGCNHPGRTPTEGVHISELGVESAWSAKARRRLNRRGLPGAISANAQLCRYDARATPWDDLRANRGLVPGQRRGPDER